MAKFLKLWWKKVIKAINPWVSSENIAKGVNWGVQVGQHFKEINLGIICITPENINAPWLTFEAEALSKFIDTSRVQYY